MSRSSKPASGKRREEEPRPEHVDRNAFKLRDHFGKLAAEKRREKIPLFRQMKLPVDTDPAPKSE
jgi:hypothetical protein